MDRSSMSCADAAARLPAGPRSAGMRPGRVKRRKTKRERDSAKFGQKVAGARRLEPRIPWRVVPVPPLPVWGCRCAGRPLRSPVSAPKPVVITQNRLSQHLGMFNREVKSIDIERLLSPCNGPETAPASPSGKDARTELQPQADLPAAPSPATDPSLQCLPEGQPRTEHGSGEPWPAAAPTAEESVPARPEPSASRAKTPTPPNNKENVPPLGPGLERGAAGLPWREIACKLRVLLGRTLAFPGRDLVGERRQTILAVLLDRHRAYPDLSALLAHKTRAADAAPQDFGSPGTPEEELLFTMGLNGGGGNSEPDASGKRRRSGGLPSACSCTPSPPQTAVKRSHFSWTLGHEETGGVLPESPATLFCIHGERRAACRESPPGQEAFGRRARALPRGELLSDSARFSPLEGPGLLCRAAPRAAPCCRASSEPAWRSRTRPEKTLVDFGEDAVEGCSWSRRLPLAVGDLGLDGTSLRRGLSLLGPQQYGLSQRPTAEPCASRHPDLVRGAAPATANVFGSAWSPGTFELAEHQLPPAPGWPHSARRHGSCSRWPRRALEGLVPCRETWELGRSNLPASSQHGVCWWEHQGSPESYQPWDHKAWELPETGPGRSLLGPEDAERLRALRRLPMSFFPPSEALERGGSPPFLAHGCLPVYSSPEAWVFPRMKLY